MTIPRAPDEPATGASFDAAPPAPPAHWRAPASPTLLLGSTAEEPVGVVHVVAEYAPFAHTGGLADAVAGLARLQASAGVPTAVVLPLHRSARRAGQELIAVGRPFPVEVGPRVEWARLWRVAAAPRAPRVFFIEHDGYFNRPGPYGTGGRDYPDNGLRWAFFAQAALAVLPRLASAPVVVHAHDWHAALVPVYLRTRFAGHPFYDRTRTVLTVHNAAFQGWFPEDLLHVVGLPAWLYDWRLMEWYGRVNYLKGGMAFADFVTTVSPTHARELVTPEGGFGLQDAFAALGDRLAGIVNGIDVETWDPATDPNLTANYSPNDLSGKRRCKAALVLAPRSGTTRRSSMPRASRHNLRPSGPNCFINSLSSARCRSAMVRKPRWISRSWVAGPTPKMKPTGLSLSIARAPSWSSAAKPRGLSMSEAILARNLLQESPTETVMPISRSTSRAKRASTFAGIMP